MTYRLYFQAYSDYLGFIFTLNDAVKGKSMRGDYHVSEVNGPYNSLESIPVRNSVFALLSLAHDVLWESAGILEARQALLKLLKIFRI